VANLSRANVHDVLRNKPRDRTVIRTEGGKTERRVIKRPEARDARQFVDLQGNVVWLKLLALGTNHGVDHIDTMLSKHKREGFVEHAKCPLRHAYPAFDARFEEEFSELPPELQKPCKADPKVHQKQGTRTIATDACPHVEWLIKLRFGREAEARELRATKIETTASIEKQKLEVAEKQLEATNKLLAHIAGGAAPQGDVDKDARIRELEAQLNAKAANDLIDQIDAEKAAPPSSSAAPFEEAPADKPDNPPED
jgi:hypothetical protein